MSTAQQPSLATRRITAPRNVQLCSQDQSDARPTSPPSLLESGSKQQRFRGGSDPRAQPHVQNQSGGRGTPCLPRELLQQRLKPGARRRVSDSPSGCGDGTQQPQPSSWVRTVPGEHRRRRRLPRYGRRNMLLVSFIITTFFAAISAGATSYPMFAVARTICGVGLTGMIIISIALVVEWTDVKHRNFCGTISSVPWTLGNMALALLAFLIRDWRWLLLAASSPCILAIIFWWWVPESARWLLTQQRAEDAHRYLSKCAIMNGRTDFPSKTTPEMLQKKVIVENRVYFYWDLVKTRRLRIVTLWAGILWFGVPFTYYGISFRITGFSLNPYLTHFIFGIIEFPAKVGVYLVLDHIGRRHCQAWSLILAGSSIAVNMAIPTEYGIVRSVIAILGKGFSEASFTTAFLYTAELYPTVLRQTGLGFTSFVARIASATAPLVLMFEDSWVLLPSLIFSVVALLCGSVAFLLPETTHVHLPETIEDVEGDRNNTAFPHSQHDGQNGISLTDMCQEEGMCRRLSDNSSHSKGAAPQEGASCVDGVLDSQAKARSSGGQRPVGGVLSECEQSSRNHEATVERRPEDK